METIDRQVKVIRRRIIIGIILAILIVAVILFYFISALTNGSPVAGQIWILFMALFISLLSIVNFLSPVIPAFDIVLKWKQEVQQKEHEKQQKDFEEFEDSYSQVIKKKLGTLSVSFKDIKGTKVDFNLENSTFTMSFDGENTYIDQKHVLSDPERLIRMDQANLQYRIMANLPKTKLVFDEKQPRYSLVAPIGSGKTLYLNKLALLAVSEDRHIDESVVWPKDISLMPVYINLVDFSHQDYIKNIGDLEISRELNGTEAGLKPSDESGNKETDSEASNEPDAEEVKKALFEFIAKTWKEDYQKEKYPYDFINYQFVKTLLEGKLDGKKEKQGVLFLLDGLDELTEKKRVKMENIIKSLYTNFSIKSAYFVIANRKHQESTFTGSDYLRLEDFCLNDIYGFATTWDDIPSSTNKDKDKENLKYQIENHPRLQALAAIPLALLNMVDMQNIAKNSSKNYLFLHRAELYQRVTDDLLDKWNKGFIDTENEPPVSSSLLGLEKRKQLLEYLAWDMHENSRTYRYPREKLLMVIREGINKVGMVGIQNDDATINTIYEELILTNGLIRAEIGVPDNYRFLCIPLQEYLASQYLVHKSEDIIRNYLASDDFNVLKAGKFKAKFIEDRYNDPWWEEVLTLFLSHSPNNTNAFVTVDTLINWLDTSTQDPFFTRSIFAGQILALDKHCDSNFMLDSQLKTITDKLCSLLKNPPFLRAQEKIYHILVDLGKDQLSLDELKELASTNRYVQYFQGVSKSSKFSPLLLHYLDENITPAVIEDISNLQSLSIDTIGDVLTSINSNPRMGIGLLCTLGVLGKRELAQTLCTLLTDTTIVTSIRVSIARVLGILGSWNQVSELIDILSNDTVDKQIRWQVVNTLGMLGSRQGFWGKATDKKIFIIDELKNKLKDRHVTVWKEIRVLENNLKIATDAGDDTDGLENNLKVAINRAKINEYIYWNIIIKFCTTFFIKPNGTNGKNNTFPLNPRIFKYDPIAKDGVDILQENSEGKNVGQAFDDLLNKAKRENSPEDVWLHLCEFIWQLADSTTLEDIKTAITRLINSIENKCILNDENKCKLRDSCNLREKCKSSELQEHVLYAEYIATRREKASVI
ncbi:MAG: NACHT domain-containing protein [Ktedonobacteraceae bacterium]